LNRLFRQRSKQRRKKTDFSQPELVQNRISSGKKKKKKKKNHLFIHPLSSDFGIVFIPSHLSAADGEVDFDAWPIPRSRSSFLFWSRAGLMMASIFFAWLLLAGLLGRQVCDASFAGHRIGAGFSAVLVSLGMWVKNDRQESRVIFPPGSSGLVFERGWGSTLPG
jgi:hypothetical protein